MTNIDNGGPAFPRSSPFDRCNQPMHTIHEGMSLRDWFAGQAISGLASRVDFD